MKNKPVKRYKFLTKCDEEGVPFIVQNFERDYFWGLLLTTFSVRLFNGDIMTVNREDADIQSDDADTDIGRDIVFHKLNKYVQSIYDGKIGGWV